VLDLLLPALCLTCDAVVDTPGALCPACFRQTGFITAPCCETCGAPFSRAEAAVGAAQRGRMCADCQDDPPPWGRARAALRYDVQARRLVLPLKYGDRTELAPALAAMMMRAGAELVREAEVIVPVPLHRTRLISRRFNQAALIAAQIARRSGRPVMLDGLVRVRRTAALAALPAEARRLEMEGAVAVRPGRVAQLRGKRVLLVDDVLTSGATARACAFALMTAGVACIDVLVAARVSDPRRR
jgi:ComF family protein